MSEVTDERADEDKVEEKAPLPPTDERLDDLEHNIAELREDERTQEAMHGSFYDPDERFYESGDERGKEMDDQAITPPG
jgi:hypothetical protein